MKKILMASAILFLFSMSILIVQTSCSKTTAQPSNNSITQLNKIIYLKGFGATGEIWTSNYDGSNATQIPVILPANVIFDNSVGTFSLSTSPDGQKVFFMTTNASGPLTRAIYSCDISGTNLTLITSGDLGKVHAF
jgi:uncharacterized membrane protein